jgi:hypothetical protein
MTVTSSRPFIAAMQVTLDGYILGPGGEADWVDSTASNCCHQWTPSSSAAGCSRLRAVLGGDPG